MKEKYQCCLCRFTRDRGNTLEQLVCAAVARLLIQPRGIKGCLSVAVCWHRQAPRDVQDLSGDTLFPFVSHQIAFDKGLLNTLFFPPLIDPDVQGKYPKVTQAIPTSQSPAPDT